MKRSRHIPGFTLLELILVVALIGVVTTMGFSMFFKVSDVWKKTRIQTDLDKRAADLFAQMQQDFGQIVSAKVSGVKIESGSQTAQDKRFFQIPLQDDHVTIPVELPAADGKPAQRIDVTYRIDRKEGATTLVRSTRIPGSKAEPTSVPVAEGVLALGIEYAAKAPGSAWQSPWTQPGMPGAIRVNVTLVGSEGSNEQISRKATFPILVD